MKIAITGSNGSVGSRVVLAALKQGHTVVGIDSNPLPHGSTLASESRFEFHLIDLTDYDVAHTALQGSDAVIHLAAIRTPDDYLVKAHNTNVVISWNILRAAADLGITRVAQASSVNVVPLVWTDRHDFKYFPIDEDHPCEPDEPYGLSKVIGELQADALVRRFPSMRIASLRLSWSLPKREDALRQDPKKRSTDLWGYVQEDSAADAFLRAVSSENDDKWSGHERFFITAPDTSSHEDSDDLRKQFWDGVPVKHEGWFVGKRGFFDCGKAERLLGWVHNNAGD